MKLINTRKTDWTLLRMGFALLVSFAVLAVCSKNSFLYPMNDWVDVNCFFTVGRGITTGLSRTGICMTRRGRCCTSFTRWRR